MILLNSSILFFSNGINTNIQLDLRNLKFTIISLESIVNYFVNGFRMILNILTRSFFTEMPIVHGPVLWDSL